MPFPCGSKSYVTPHGLLRPEDGLKQEGAQLANQADVDPHGLLRPEDRLKLRSAKQDVRLKALLTGYSGLKTD